MPSRSELVVRASAVGLDPTTAGYYNDSKLEQRVLWLEKRGTTFSGTISTTTLTNVTGVSTDGDTTLIGNTTYTYKTALTETAASTTLTISGTPSDGDIVSIGGYAYTFRTTLTNGGTTPGEVHIGGSAANSCTNIGYAIANTGGTVGTDYGSGNTANTAVTVGTVSSSTVALTASVSLTNATQGNQIQTSVITGTNEAFTGAFFAGGVNAVANQVLIGGSVTNQLANLKSAINGTTGMGTAYSTGTAAHTQVVASTKTSTTLLINANDFEIANADIATTNPTNTGTVNVFTGTTMASGVRKQIATNTTTSEGANGLAGDAVVWI